MRHVNCPWFKAVPIGGIACLLATSKLRLWFIPFILIILGNTDMSHSTCLTERGWMGGGEVLKLC